jgi:hypothetical protein
MTDRLRACPEKVADFSIRTCPILKYLERT